MLFLHNLRFTIIFCCLICLPTAYYAQNSDSSNIFFIISEIDPTRNGFSSSSSNGINKPSFLLPSLYFTENKVIKISVLMPKQDFITLIMENRATEFTKYKNNYTTSLDTSSSQYDNHINQPAIIELLRKSCDNVSIFNDNISLLDHDFISPFGKEAAKNYVYFYKKDTLYEGVNCRLIQFNGNKRAINTFSGWFCLADTSYTQFLRNPTNALEKEDFMLKNNKTPSFKIVDTTVVFTGNVVKAILRLSNAANINFIDEVIIEENYQLLNKQEYQNIWSPSIQDINIQMTIKIPFLSYFLNLSYGQMLKPLSKFKLEQKKEFSSRTTQLLTTEKENIIINENKKIAQKLWQDEIKVDSIMQTTKFKHIKNLVYALATGAIPIKSIEIGNIYNVYQSNPIQGDRLRFSVGNSGNFLPNWNLQTNFAYGLLDKKLRLGATVEHKMLINKNLWQFGLKYQDEVSQNRITGNTTTFLEAITTAEKLMGKYDSNTIIKNFLKFDNVFIANIDVAYWSMFAKVNVAKNFSTEFNAIYSLVRNDSSFYYAVLKLEKNSLKNTKNGFSTIETGFSFQYAPSEEYLKGQFLKLKIKSGYEPVFTGSIQIGSRMAYFRPYCYLKMTYNQNFKLKHNTWLEFDTQANAVLGDGLNPLLLLSPNAQSSPIAEPLTVNTIGMYEFQYNRYAQVAAAWHGRGYIFDKIPVFQYLKLREVVEIKALYGKLDDTELFKNTNRDLYNKKSYFEAGIGLENVLKVLRLDCYAHVNPVEGHFFDRFIFKITSNFSF